MIEEFITYAIIAVLVFVMGFLAGWWMHQFKTATDKNKKE